MPAQGVLASASPAAETESWSGIDLFASVKTLLPAEPSPGDGAAGYAAGSRTAGV